jgi:hypothetical protein
VNEPRAASIGASVRLTQQKEFRGALVPLLARSLDRRTLPASSR